MDDQRGQCLSIQLGTDLRTRHLQQFQLLTSLLFFLALPVLLRLGVAFWPALAGAGVITATGYVVWLAAARGLGVGG